MIAEQLCICGRELIDGRCPKANSPSHPVRVAMLSETMVDVARIVDERRGTEVGWAEYSNCLTNRGVARD